MPSGGAYPTTVQSRREGEDDDGSSVRDATVEDEAAFDREETLENDEPAAEAVNPAETMTARSSDASVTVEPKQEPMRTLLLPKTGCRRQSCVSAATR